MILSLKNPSSGQFPQHGWPYSDPRTGMSFNGYQGSPAMIAVKIAAHRAANPKFYPNGEGQNIESIIQEIYANKFRTMPWLFKGQPDQGGPAYQSAAQAQAVVPEIVNGAACACGSTQYEAVYCKTCAGRRVVGRKCAKCGKAA